MKVKKEVCFNKDSLYNESRRLPKGLLSQRLVRSSSEKDVIESCIFLNNIVNRGT